MTNMELQDYSLGRILFTIWLIGFIGLFTRLLQALILKPSRIRSKLREQGIQGPPPSLLLGNLRDVMKMRFKGSTLPKQGDQQVITHNSSDIYPFYDQWKEQYGSTFMFSIGNAQILSVSDPNLVKEMSICTSLDLGRSSFLKQGIDPIAGQGIVNSDGAIWAHERKTIAPEFYMNKVKGMMKIIAESATTVVNSWKIMIDNGGGVADIKIDDLLRRFAGDVISRACFGSNYAEGEQIFLKIRNLQETVIKTFMPQVIPGLRYLPTKSNKKIRGLEKEIRTLILKLVNDREEAASENDLLQLILQSSSSNNIGEYAMDDFIVDNCKSIYLAGYETTGVSATWTLMLLALHPEWQDKVRAEVLEVCGSCELPNADMLRQMKILTMVINESLRLYPPLSTVLRGTREDMKIGNIFVPKGVNLWILIAKLHQDFDIWGHDADKFNPHRFVEGLRHACKFPHAYIPFGIGSHTCLGQQLAMVELKMLLAVIISNFTFSISPNYRHHPCASFAIEPEFGVDLLVRRLADGSSASKLAG